MLNTVINGYKLLRYIDKGGMAEVWYAENKIGKPAAIKVLLQKFCDDKDIIERFENEAKLMVALKHDHIRSVYDYEEIEGRPCIIMEYLDGESLSKLMATNNRFSEKQLIQWWKEMVSVLNYTHSQGVIHRDIKPSNIFITSEGKLKLLDFGIAKVKEGINITMTGQGLGTMIYMSPEQIKDPKRVTYQTDVYSLAVTFFHLLTNKQPYDRNSTSDFEIQTRIVNEPLNLDLLTPAWRQFLLGFLQKDPEKRKSLTEFPTILAEDHTVVDTKIHKLREQDQTTTINIPATPSREEDQTAVQNFDNKNKQSGKTNVPAMGTILCITAIPILMLIWNYKGLLGYFRIFTGNATTQQPFSVWVFSFLWLLVIQGLGIACLLRFFKIYLKQKDSELLDMPNSKPFYMDKKDKKLIMQQAILYIVAFAACWIAYSPWMLTRFHISHNNSAFPEFWVIPGIEYLFFIGATYSRKTWPFRLRQVNLWITLITVLHVAYSVFAGHLLFY